METYVLRYTKWIDGPIFQKRLLAKSRDTALVEAMVFMKQLAPHGKIVLLTKASRHADTEIL